MTNWGRGGQGVADKGGIGGVCQSFSPTTILGGGGEMCLTEGFFSIFFKFSAFIASALTFVIALVLQKNYLALLAL